jgi:thiamine biosynthesis lipoprotein
MESMPVSQTTHYAMGTVMTHKAFGLFAEDSLVAVCREVARIEGRLSRFLPDSEISRVNGSAGVRSEKVGPETYDVLSKSVEFSRSFPGCFDVTVKPLVTLWSTAKESFAQPDEASIKQLLPLVNYRDLTLDPGEMTAGLRRRRRNLLTWGSGKDLPATGFGVFRKYGVYSASSISAECGHPGRQAGRQPLASASSIPGKKTT